jgi:hypothetical protein
MITMDDVVDLARQHFVGRDVYFTPSELPANIVIPAEWMEFGIGTLEYPKFPLAWYSFREKLPWVLSLLETCLIGTVVLGGDNVELVYVFHDSNGLYYYIGGMPLNSCPLKDDKVSPVKGELSRFYSHVHNGFTFFPAQSMGPQKIEDFSCVADLIDEEETSFAENWVTVFSNGGGDYLAIDLNNQAQDKGIIWWHEQPMDPAMDVDVFEIMDTWISIFLEDTQSRNDVLIKKSDFKS